MKYCKRVAAICAAVLLAAAMLGTAAFFFTRAKN